MLLLDELDASRTATPVLVLTCVLQPALDNAPLVDGMSTFKRTIAKLDLNLPKGQMTHVLRHTFASHFMINGGNIITLQRVLGHSSIMMTMRYAHLAPGHLAEVLHLNPIGKCL